MAENKDSQAAFMEAVGSIKEYAKVNGNIVTREDVHSCQLSGQQQRKGHQIHLKLHL